MFSHCSFKLEKLIGAVAQNPRDLWLVCWGLLAA